ncbi:MAG: riboflavin synthase subunit alpha [Pirellulaceae bacterium]|nr:MAG: riboflavin synthase subunit alpha [Pirellulaceae bacterium]
MFTGIVERTGRIGRVEPLGEGVQWEIVVEDERFLERVAVGDSVCVSGCCLTATMVSGCRFGCQLAPETLSRTTFGRKSVGAIVNLERSLRVGDSLGGHFVTGHVDGVGRLVQREDRGEWVDCWFSAPPEMMELMAEKGSIAVDGVSLTLCDVLEERFRVALIPHTLAVTTLGSLKIGDEVNLEADLLAKYVARQLQAWRHERRG